MNTSGTTRWCWKLKIVINWAGSVHVCIVSAHGGTFHSRTSSDASSSHQTWYSGRCFCSVGCPDGGAAVAMDRTCLQTRCSACQSLPASRRSVTMATPPSLRWNIFYYYLLQPEAELSSDFITTAVHCGRFAVVFVVTHKNQTLFCEINGCYLETSIRTLTSQMNFTHLALVFLVCSVPPPSPPCYWVGISRTAWNSNAPRSPQPRAPKNINMMQSGGVLSPLRRQRGPVHVISGVRAQRARFHYLQITRGQERPSEFFFFWTYGTSAEATPPPSFPPVSLPPRRFRSESELLQTISFGSTSCSELPVTLTISNQFTDFYFFN